MTTKIKLEPVDKKRCQAERRLGAFQLGGDAHKVTRCANEATHVVKFKDRRKKGAMSVCGSCKPICESYMPGEVDFFEIRGRVK